MELIRLYHYYESKPDKLDRAYEIHLTYGNEDTDEEFIRFLERMYELDEAIERSVEILEEIELGNPGELEE